MLLGFLHLLLLAYYASANDQVVIGPHEQEAITECKHLEQDGKIYIPTQDSDGGWTCVVCVGTPYVSPKTGLRKCCMFETLWTVDPVNVKEGKCCPTGTTYSVDSAVGKGECCSAGESFVGTACQRSGRSKNIAPSSSSHAVPTSDVKPLTLTPQHWPSCFTSPGDVSPKCSCPGNSTSCPPAGTLGIRYGRCYTMRDFDGNEFTRDYADFYYYLGTRVVKNIVFRICATTANCTSRQDEYVPEGGTWYQHDQTGVPERAETSFLGNFGGFVVITFKSQPFLWLELTAKATCVSGKCPICLRAVSTGISPQTATPLGITTADAKIVKAVAGPNICFPAFYQETTCLSFAETI